MEELVSEPSFHTSRAHGGGSNRLPAKLTSAFRERNYEGAINELPAAAAFTSASVSLNYAITHLGGKT